jgi:hypothetical protein
LPRDMPNTAIATIRMTTTPIVTMNSMRRP